MKTVKSRLFEKYLKKKMVATVLFVSWLATYQWKNIIENCNSVGAVAQNIGIVVSFWPNFDPNFTDVWRA